jgi:hypothetical protein
MTGSGFREAPLAVLAVGLLLSPFTGRAAEVTVADFVADYRSAAIEDQDLKRLDMLKHIRGYREAFENVYTMEGMFEDAEAHADFVDCTHRVSGSLFDDLLAAETSYGDVTVGRYFWHVLRTTCGEEVLGPYPDPSSENELIREKLREYEEA